MSANPVSRPGRLLRVLFRVAVVILLVGLGLGVIGFIAAPTIGVQVARSHLPWSVRLSEKATVAVTGVETVPGGQSMPDLQVTVTAARSRALAMAALERWLPPGLLRTGQHADGTLSLPSLRLRPFSWQVLVGGVDPAPQISLRLPATDLNRLLSDEARSEVALPGLVMICTYVVDAGQVEGDDLPGQSPLVRRLKVTARGSIIAEVMGLRRVLQVRRLAGHALLTYTPDVDGLRVACTVRIEEADTDELNLPIIGDTRALLLKQLEVASNRGLKKSFSKLLLPAWFPADLRIDAEVEPAL